MAATPPVSLEVLKKYPTMTRWFNPLLLSKLLLKVVVSEMFGQYADRRLIMAALDTLPEKELFDRTQLKLPLDADGNLWVDYLADLGDGFDSTYAIASLLAKETLNFGGTATHRGALLIMGAAIVRAPSGSGRCSLIASSASAVTIKFEQHSKRRIWAAAVTR